jgi:20S proteasome subunit alpha 6
LEVSASADGDSTRTLLLSDNDIGPDTRDHFVEVNHEPPASNSSPITDGPGSSGLPQQRPSAPSANRLSISYTGETNRVVIDAEVVESLKVFRSEARIEITINLSTLGGSLSTGGDNPSEQGTSGEGLRGIWLETTSDKATIPIPLGSSLAAQLLTESGNNASAKTSIPPFMKASPLPTTILLTAYLDTTKPLSEAKWVKTGDVQDWLRSMFGRMFWAAGDAANKGWEKRIVISDPDSVSFNPAV